MTDLREYIITRFSHMAQSLAAEPESETTFQNMDIPMDIIGSFIDHDISVDALKKVRFTNQDILEAKRSKEVHTYELQKFFHYSNVLYNKARKDNFEGSEVEVEFFKFRKYLKNDSLSPEFATMIEIYASRGFGLLQFNWIKIYKERYWYNNKKLMELHTLHLVESDKSNTVCDDLTIKELKEILNNLYAKKNQIWINSYLIKRMLAEEIEEYGGVPISNNRPIYSFEN